MKVLFHGSSCIATLLQIAFYFAAVSFPTIALAYKKIDDRNINDAVSLLCMDQSRSELIYGPIDGWDTSSVTSMNR
eukprot:scaffold3626_cov288-Chaetoceros_neogracile.AAC.1